MTRTSVDSYTGTGFLLRFYLRLDGKRIGIWAGAFFVLIYFSVATMDGAYPTQEALQGRASLMYNPAAIMMTGPALSLDNYTFGAMLANELSLWTFLPAAIMSVLLVVRHTRQDEESGRMETVRALAVGRYAPTAATLIVVLIANGAVGAAVSIALITQSQPIPDSVAYGLGTGLLGLLFGAVAALTSQLTEHARTASGSAMAVLAVTAIVRGFGDVINPTGSWLSWFSPIAWVQQTRLYVDLRWWPLTLVFVATVLVTGAALRLSRKRDLGAGMVSPRPGPALADASLLSPFGIANRLLSGTFIGWTAGLLVFAVAFGALASSLEPLVADNPAISEWVPIDMGDLTLSFAAVILALLAIGPAILVVTSIGQLKSEERSGRLDEVLIAGSSRSAVLTAWLTVSTLWALGSMLALGLGTGVGLTLVTGEPSRILDLTLASAAYFTALLVTSALAALAYGLGLQFMAITWSYVAFVSIEVYLGDVLNLPSSVRSLSPIWQTPLIPYESWNGTPLAVMTGIAALMYGAAFAAFTRRDLAIA